MLAISAVVFALAAAQAAPTGPTFSRDALLTDKDAVFLLDPEVIAGPGVSRLKWSPDGTYLLVQRDRLIGPHPFLLMAQGKTLQGPLAGESQFLFYSAPSQKTVPGLKLPIGTHIDRIEWIPGSSKALAIAQVPVTNENGDPIDTKQTLYWMSANGAVRPLAEAAEGEYFDIFVNPHRPLVALARTEFRAGNPPTREQSLHFFDGEGKLVGKVAMPEPTDSLTYLPDGRIFASVGKVVNRKVVWEWFRLSPSQGTREKVDNFTPPKPSSPPLSDLVVESGTMPSSRPELPGVEAVFMTNRSQVDAKSKSPDVVFVSSDAKLGSLSPNGNSVAYVHKGVAMVRPLARLPKQMYLDMKASAERGVAISNAKQAALALIMNASDEDDNLIANGENWRDKVMPYIKNRDILNAFTYTFGGGNMASIDKPAETEIGYVTGPGGRAVAYADGHVKWLPDK